MRECGSRDEDDLYAKVEGVKLVEKKLPSLLCVKILKKQDADRSTRYCFNGRKDEKNTDKRKINQGMMQGRCRTQSTRT